jgi:hypothetical protein
MSFINGLRYSLGEIRRINFSSGNLNLTNFRRYFILMIEYYTYALAYASLLSLRSIYVKTEGNKDRN